MVVKLVFKACRRSNYERIKSCLLSTSLLLYLKVQALFTLDTMRLAEEPELSRC
ncbi:MAG: hypothetical protein ACI9XU_000081 [Arenicella sp.]|jgi:hypothetical protein